MGQLIDLDAHRAERERELALLRDGAASEAETASRRNGRVLLFTGVRYERMDAEPVRERAGA